MARILISGASGFIGVHLAQAAVSQGYDVTCLVQSASPSKRLDGLNVRRVCGDVMDRRSLAAAIQGQDVVFHLAGCLKAIQAKGFHEVNALGTPNVAEVCAFRNRRSVVVQE